MSVHFMMCLRSLRSDQIRPDIVSRALKTGKGKHKCIRKRNVTTGVGSESSDVAGFENGGREP